MTVVESVKVAVIGGGPAGLASARVLSRNGIQPVVFEKEVSGGGVWRYTPNSKTLPMYKGLRTNLPREIMAYREKPWGGPGKSYVTHYEVLDYLQAYNKDFGLDQFICYGSKVTQLTMVSQTSSTVSTESERWPKIQLEWETNEGKEKDVFDAVCVANGHFAIPSFPHLTGIEHFKGRILHSIEYDEPASFENQVVLCIGGRASGSDLAREISELAAHVYLSDSTMESVDVLGNVSWVPRTLMVNADGTIQFDHACQAAPMVDVIIFCTGYDYSFPFINENSNTELNNAPGERRVTPLFKQLWHAHYPNLSFIGLPHSVIPFPLFEHQAEAVTRQFIGSCNLPPREKREEAAALDAVKGGAKMKGRLEDTHYLGSAQWDYCRDLAECAGLLDEELDRNIATNKTIYEHASLKRGQLFPGGPDTYRGTCYTRDDITKSFLLREPTDPLLES